MTCAVSDNMRDRDQADSSLHVHFSLMCLNILEHRFLSLSTLSLWHLQHDKHSHPPLSAVICDRCSERVDSLHCYFPQQVVNVTVKGPFCLSTYEALLGALVLPQLHVSLAEMKIGLITALHSVVYQNKSLLTCPQRKRAFVLLEFISKALLAYFRALCGLSRRSSVKERFKYRGSRAALTFSLSTPLCVSRFPSRVTPCVL